MAHLHIEYEDCPSRIQSHIVSIIDRFQDTDLASQCDPAQALLDEARQRLGTLAEPGRCFWQHGLIVYRGGNHVAVCFKDKSRVALITAQ